MALAMSTGPRISPPQAEYLGAAESADAWGRRPSA
jgi:hypothetical protein